MKRVPVELEEGQKDINNEVGFHRASPRMD